MKIRDLDPKANIPSDFDELAVGIMVDNLRRPPRACVGMQVSEYLIVMTREEAFALSRRLAEVAEGLP